MSCFATWTLLSQVASTLAMVGVIWFVQVVHYPLFARVGEPGFGIYELEHQRRTSWVVAPLMLTELATAVLLLWYCPPGVSRAAVIVGLALLALIWITTYAVQVPQHTQLQQQFSLQLQQRLVAGNWVRTIAWTLRGIVVLAMVSASTTSGPADLH